MDQREIQVTTAVIRFEGPGGWHGIFLPIEAVAELRFFGLPNAMGAIAVEARVGETTVRTSLFPDSKRDSFLLPLKAELRRREKIAAGDTICVTLRFAC